MAFSFNGSSIISFANPYEFKAGDSITCACYFYRPSSAPNLYEYLLAQHLNNDTVDSAANTNTPRSYNLVLPNNTGGTKIRLLSVTDGTLFYTETTNNDWSENKWELYVVSFNGNMSSSGQSKIWRNASSIASSTTTSSDTFLDAPGIWTIGGRYASGTGLLNVFTGKIEYIAVWNTFLHDDESRALTLGISPFKVRQENLVFMLKGQNPNEIIDVVNGRKGQSIGVGYVRGPSMSYY